MKAVAFIFARGGSKGLPGKNIKMFGDKPLVAWSIEHAFAISRIGRVIVSTDSNEIADVALHYGAEVPFIRPFELAQDDSPEWLSWRHGLKYLLDSTGVLPDALVTIPTTAPLRLPIDIENCLNEYEQGNADVVITVTKAHRNPYFNMIKINPLNNNAELVNQTTKAVFRRQDVPPIYDMTTVCYVANPKFVISANNIFEGKVRAVQVPTERAIDIDTQLDFEIARSLLKLRGEGH